MPTTKQRRAVETIVENGGNVSQAMIAVGYSENTAHTPQKLTESVGFKELCDELGLTETLLTQALVEDIKNKKGNRKAELELGYKVRGLLKDGGDKPITNNILVVSHEQLRTLAERALRGGDSNSSEVTGT